MGSISPANERQGFSHQEEDDIVQTSSPVSTPPAPPPLLLPGSGDSVAATGGLWKMRMRGFFWKTIPEEKVRGRANLWNRSAVMPQYTIDVQKVEELFVQSNCQSNATAMPLREGRVMGSSKEMVCILNLKRAMNIEIFLKHFKRSSERVVDDIRHGNSDTYGAELLRELLKLLPNTEEVKKLRSYQGDASLLSLADSFMYQLIQLPCYSLRVESMLFKEEFPGVCEAIRRDIRILHSATRELMCCEELHTVLHLLLQAGNILSSGGHSGDAVGFKLSSLLSLSNIKANRDGMNLLHFVAMEAQKKDKQLLQFPLKLTHIPAAARISIDTLDNELQYLTSRTLSVEEGIRRDAELEQQLDELLQAAASFLSLLRVSRQQLQEHVGKLIDFFCEERDIFRLDDCFSVFYTFCCNFTAAVKENMEWEVKEAALHRCLQELEGRRWHLWAGNKKVSRFHTAGLLVDPKSPHPSPLTNTLSPMEHTGSLSHLQNSPSSSPLVAAEHGLEVVIPDSKKREGVSVKSEHEVPTCSIQQIQQPFEGEMQTQLSPPQNTNESHTTVTYLNCDAPHNPAGGDSSTKKHSSDWNQVSNNNSSNRHSSKPVRTDQNEIFEHAANNMSMCLLKTHKVPTMSHMEMYHKSYLHQQHQDIVIITDLEKDGDTRSLVQTLQMGNSKACGKSFTSTQKQEEEEQDKHVPDGLCANDVQVQMEKNHCWSNGQEGKQEASFFPVTRMPSGPQSASEKPVPPIIIQPVQMSRCDDSSFQECFSKQKPAAKEVPALTTGDTEGGKETAIYGRGAETSIIKTKSVDPLSQQSADDNSASCHVTNDNKEAASNNEKKEQTTSSNSSAKKATTSTTRAVAVKPKTTQPCTSNMSKPVHTFTSFKNQGMRHVCPISRISTISRQDVLSLGKCPDKKLGHQQKSLTTAALNSAPLRHGERPSVTPLSRRSSVYKTQETDQEKGVRAPPTPLHKPSSVRRANATFVRPAPPNSINTGSDSGHKSSLKTSTSAPPNMSLPLPRIGLSRVSTSSSSLLTKSQSIRVPPRLPLHESIVTPPKGYRKNDSSGRGTQSRDSAKTERPSRKQLVSGRRREVSGHIPI